VRQILTLDLHSRCEVMYQKTKQSAREAAIAKACKLFITSEIEDLVISEEKLRDPYSDKEVLIPEIDRREWKEVTQGPTNPAGVPHITISFDENDILRRSQSIADGSVRRSASDSHLSRRHVSGSSSVSNLLDNPSTTAKKHNRSMTITRGQLSPPLQNTEWNPGDGQITTLPQPSHTRDDSFYTNLDNVCPVCDSSLDGLSEHASSTHVNGCLDDQLVPISSLHRRARVL
jgi:hypothetical protein